MSIYPQIIYLAATIFLAYIEDKRIDKTYGVKPNISHFISAVLGIGPYLLINFIFHPHWSFIFFCMLIRAISYTIALNLFRGENFNYVSDTTSSIIDRIERKIFGKSFFIPKAIYFILFLTLNKFL